MNPKLENLLIQLGDIVQEELARRQEPIPEDEPDSDHLKAVIMQAYQVVRAFRNFHMVSGPLGTTPDMVQVRMAVVEMNVATEKLCRLFP